MAYLNVGYLTYSNQGGTLYSGCQHGQDPLEYCLSGIAVGLIVDQAVPGRLSVPRTAVSTQDGCQDGYLEVNIGSYMAIWRSI